MPPRALTVARTSSSVFKLLPWLASMAVLAAALTYGRQWHLPDRHNPWAPLHIEEPPGWLTRYKLARLDDAPAVCLSTLEQATMRFQPVPDRAVSSGCGFDNAVRIERTSVQVGEPFTLSCPAAVSLALWERHALQPAAASMLGSGVRRIEHYGSFACRNVYGREGGRRSQHATADALDVAGFVLDDGRRITVASHWHSGDERSAFLRSIQAQACVFFDGVFGPDYNAAHADHLHLDRGPFRLCR
jgi:hypothetical protein